MSITLSIPFYEAAARLDYATLLIAKEVQYSQLDIHTPLAELDRFTRLLHQRIKPHDHPRTRINRITELLFEEETFYGNREDYYDPRNSFLNDVLERQTGIPITLSIIYITLGERLGIPIYGVGLPGHFVVGCRHRNEVIYVDPFNEGIMLSEDECRELAQSYLRPGAVLPQKWLTPTTNMMILSRILNNLRHIYFERQMFEQLLPVLKLQYALTPEDISLLREIGALHAHFEEWGKAVQHLRRYLYYLPHDYKDVREAYNQALGQLSKLN